MQHTQNINFTFYLITRKQFGVSESSFWDLWIQFPCYSNLNFQRKRRMFGSVKIQVKIFSLVVSPHRHYWFFFYYSYSAISFSMLCSSPLKLIMQNSRMKYKLIICIFPSLHTHFVVFCYMFATLQCAVSIFLVTLKFAQVGIPHVHVDMLCSH